MTIETNTEELREILQTVYDLPNAGGGSSEPDLVINLNMASGKYAFSAIAADDFSYTGELQTVKAKILNGENVNIVVKHGYHYGITEYTGTVVPTQFGVTDYGDRSVTYVEFILACCPGIGGTSRRFFAVEIDDAGVISMGISGDIL